MSNKSFDFSDFEMTGAAGIDAHFTREASQKTAAAEGVKYGRRKVATMGDLTDFVRLSSEQLIHKSERDLWALKKEADGSYFIERLFDDNGTPLKG